MKKIEELFIPYQEAKELKFLCFDKPCVAYFNIRHDVLLRKEEGFLKLTNDVSYLESQKKMTYIIGHMTLLAPTWEQAFEFFRDNFKIDFEIKKIQEGYTYHFFKSQEEFIESVKKLFDEERQKYCFDSYDKARLEGLKAIINSLK